MSKRTFLLRRGGLGLTLGVLAAPVAVVCASCVTPENDYTDYLARADAAVVPGNYTSGDGAAVKTYAPDAGFTDQNFLGACITSVAATADKALLYVSTVTFAPTASGGNVSVSLRPLNVGSTTVNNPPADANTYTLMGTVNSMGVGSLTYGPDINIPASTNAIEPEAATLTKTLLEVTVQSPTKLCALLSGQLTQPIAVTLAPEPCIFLPTNPTTGTFPSFDNSDFHCP